MQTGAEGANPILRMKLSGKRTHFLKSSGKYCSIGRIFFRLANTDGARAVTQLRISQVFDRGVRFLNVRFLKLIQKDQKHSG